MTSILECKDINELIKLGWSYPLKTGSVSDITGGSVYVYL